ncbi:ThuA domain-containing protein [Amaricoccus tamworthensis]|uniref:ThuA domain-containing protein n=1 Tax=Amaricoccus tamworthensis TaxID=57002 RepID=UPI003C79D022
MTKKALIVWGGWEGHTPLASGEAVRDMLQNNGYEVDLEPGTRALGDPGLGRYDLIVPMITQDVIAKDELSNLVATIAEGTGLAGFHGTMGDSFRQEPDYQFMVGGQWVAHPGNIIDYRINITRPDDPVMEGISDFDYHSEQYYMHVDPAVEVLATTTFSGKHCDFVEGVVMPVVWKKRYGRARVFYSALGHEANEFKVPEMYRIFERGALWATR